VVGLAVRLGRGATIASVFFWADRAIGAWYGAMAVAMATAQMVTLGEVRHRRHPQR
jgi:hypothetical protein